MEFEAGGFQGRSPIVCEGTAHGRAVTPHNLSFRVTPAFEPSFKRAHARGRRVTTSHSSGPLRLRSIRVCTRRLTISMSTGPFSPSRTVTWVHTSAGSERRHAVTDGHGALGRRPRPAYAGNGASRSRLVVVQGTPHT